MTDPANGNVIVVNGEIYNHQALRAQLGPDVSWKGTSDTETLLQGYRALGPRRLDHLKGMFAFAIYDAAREELFLARDRLGIKPLYYAMDANGFRAASEVKSARRSLDPSGITGQSISGYLQWGACPERNLLYSDLRALPAGHAMTIGRQGQIKTWRYWPSREGICFLAGPRCPASARSDRQGCRRTSSLRRPSRQFPQWRNRLVHCDRDSRAKTGEKTSNILCRLRPCGIRRNSDRAGNRRTLSDPSIIGSNFRKRK